jgi:hypothetical protein
MVGLGKTIQFYANDFNDSLPPGDKWCDVLAGREGMTMPFFVCVRAHLPDHQSSYAINANVVGRKVGELPGDVVLLFESKPGWNQVGGPELLSTENHEGKGCSILFGDRHAEFVERKRLATLKWKPD